MDVSVESLPYQSFQISDFSINGGGGDKYSSHYILKFYTGVEGYLRDRALA